MLNLKAPQRPAGAAVALLALLAGPALADDTALTGAPALAGETPQVSGILSVQETGPLERTLELTMADAETGEPITAYDEELTQELHVIATDSAFTTFVHEHAETVDADGRFHVEIAFPKPGLYHIYTDAVPTGLEQQVLRFDLKVGEARDASMTPPEPQSGDVLSSSAGPYQVEIDVADLRAGENSMVTLQILKDRHLAADLAPYLGVPAHAVFIATDNLAYVHAHATPTESGDAHEPASQGHDGHGMDMAMEETSAAPSHGSEEERHAGHGAEETHEAVPASLLLHVAPPAPGTYALWIQFMGDGQVRTAPFMISVE